MFHKTYSELRRIDSFEERFDYLKLKGVVGQATFGFDRYLNQSFYRSVEWKQIRHEVIVRDNGCDLGIDGHEIYEPIYIHHLNPITPEDIKEGSHSLLDLNNLISVTHQTHNAIHYGDANLLRKGPIERRAGDTRLW